MKGKEFSNIRKTVFPDLLKLANITLVHKKDQTFVYNYRPVTVYYLHVFDKIIQKQLLSYTDQF